MNPKIHPTHLSRVAVVYLRQSSVRQLRENRESTVRQYALGERARTLGWPVERIELVDEDLGTSGSSTLGRSGFQRLAEDVAHGRIGAVVALEVSRLARSSADWHRLLELCGLADVVLVDEDCVYSPADYNDRLLLGLKGQMSEAELYWMRLRLHGGKLNKARRGELVMRVPIGYQWEASSGKPEMDDDREVREALQLVFARFRLEGSAYGVVRYFVSHGLRLPARAVGASEVRWVMARAAPILDLLHNPIYAGAYVFGRHRHRQVLLDGELRRTTTRVPLPQWPICIQGHHAGYISWEEFMENQRRLTENCLRAPPQASQGAPREGGALLQGMVLCGKCASRMSTRPQGKGRPALYYCRSTIDKIGGTRECWSVSSKAVDEAVAALVLDAICPEEIELGLAVLQEADKQARELAQQWKLRLDTAGYEARLAERRYKAVDPDNRTVASTLERAWEEKLTELRDLEQEYQAVVRRRKLELSPQDHRRILELARDLPRVFWAETTTTQQRKSLLRLVLEVVTLSPMEEPGRSTRIQALWQTGAVTELTIDRPSPDRARSASGATAEKLRELYPQTKSDRQLAELLNREGHRTGQKKPWTRGSAQHLRAKLGLRRCEEEPPNARRPERRADGLYSTHGVAARFGVSEATVREWRGKGLLEAVEGDRYHAQPLWFRIDEATVERIQRYRVANELSSHQHMFQARSVLRTTCRRDKQGRWRRSRALAKS